MNIDNISVFGIESQITRAYKNPSQLALGFFVIYLKGKRYGVRDPEATLLGSSMDAVKRRIARRGEHTIPFDPEAAAGEIADAYLAATYDESSQGDRFFGMSSDGFRDTLVAKDVIWAPDGDAAFDDGGHILQFDVGDRVRLIAFRNVEESTAISRDVSDVWLNADEFYGLLARWRTAFENEWVAAIKVV